MTPFFIVSVFFSNVNSLLPFLEKFLICKKEMLADRPRAWLAFADLQTPFFPHEEFVGKKNPLRILWSFE